MKYMKLIVIMACACASIALADFSWQASCYFYDQNGTSGNWLVKEPNQLEGVFAQLIYAGANGVADSIDAAGTTGVTGDDVIYDVSWFGEDGYDGDDHDGGGAIDPDIYDGFWWFPSVGKTITAGASEDEYVFYARVFAVPASSWNGLSTTLAADAWYYQSPTWTYDNDVVGDFDMTPVREGQTGLPLDYVSTSTGQVIPEPSSIALGLVGLVLLRVFRRKKA